MHWKMTATAAFRGETYYLASPICRLLRTAAEADGLGKLILTTDLTPSREAFVWLADPITVGDEVYHAFTWQWLRVQNSPGAPPGKSWSIACDRAGWVYDHPESNGIDLWLIFHGLEQVGRIPARARGIVYGTYWLPGYSLDDRDQGRPSSPADDDPIWASGRHFAAALFAFLQQHLLTAKRYQADRATRRRIMTRPLHEPVVRVVELRRKESAVTSTENGISPEWSCQWLVRGHWRQQWYPTMDRHQPRWIAPYVKGPEDKPLKPPRATVFAVVR